MDEPRLTGGLPAEFIGTTLGIVGSGIAASRLSHGDPGFTVSVDRIL
jgi:hypothetical protein